MLTTTPAKGALQRWHAAFSRESRAFLRPTPRLTLSQWAEKYRHWKQGTAQEAGRYRTDRTPYLVEIMDALTDPAVERMVIWKPARVGFTEGVIVNGIGYYMHQDPSPILVVLPTIDDAEKFSKEKLTPAIEATPVMRERMPDPRSRDSGNTILTKLFPGGRIGMVGTNSPRMLRMRDARVVFCDEVDAYPPSAGEEGDPVALAFKRADNWDNRKLVIGSSPKLKGFSRIERAYGDSDQRKWWVRCPRCAEPQILLWGGKDTAFGMKWAPGRPETAVYVCLKGCTIEERSKRDLNASGQWRQDNPGHRTFGWWWNALISPLPSGSWPKIAAEWLGAQDKPEELQVFVNTVLSETWELRGEKIEGDPLFNRREVYSAEVPAGVGVLTAFVDVQDAWLEVLVRGWGKDQESWRILHVRIEGDPEGADVWDQVDGVIFRAYQHESGATLRIRRTFIDSGFRTAAVYGYVKPRQARQVFASKGDKQLANAPVVVRAKKPNDAGVKLMTIGTFTAKRRLFSRLKLSRVGAGYYHFHRLPDSAEIAERAAFDAQDRQFFQQFASEKLLPGKDARGRPILVYQQIADRNESIDLEVGNLAVLYSLGPAIYERLDREAARVNARGAAATEGQSPAPDQKDPDPDDAPEPPKRPDRNSFIFGY